MDSGFTARWSGLPAAVARRPVALPALNEVLPRALTHRRAAQPVATRLFELAGLIILLAIGLAVDAVGAWIVIAMPMTAIVVLLLADLEAGRRLAANTRADQAPGAAILERAPRRARA